MSAPLRDAALLIEAWAGISEHLRESLTDPDARGGALMLVSEHRDAIVWPMCGDALVTIHAALVEWATGHGRLVVVILTDQRGARYVAPTSLRGE